MAASAAMTPKFDYFPQKLTVEYAVKFSVEYFNHYKVVKVADAFDDAPGFDYVLVQCGTPMPRPLTLPPARNSSRSQPAISSRCRQRSCPPCLSWDCLIISWRRQRILHQHARSN